jgi:hypothetical protein
MSNSRQNRNTDDKTARKDHLLSRGLVDALLQNPLGEIARALVGGWLTGIAGARATALRIGEDQLAFSIAVEARNTLRAAQDRRLSAACTLLDGAITAALPTGSAA